MVLNHYKIDTAPFAVITSSQLLSETELTMANFIAASAHADAMFTFPLFVKPACECSGQGVDSSSRITCPEEFPAVVSRLSSRFPGQDLLVERFLRGREFTVGIVGTGDSAVVVGVTEVVFRSARPLKGENRGHVDEEEYHVYGSAEKSSWQTCPQYIYYRTEEADPAAPTLQLPSTTLSVRSMDRDTTDVAETALRAWRALGCRDGGRVDLRYDGTGSGAKPHVIEVSKAWISESLMINNNTFGSR
jgi:D-alanine-D-alanine ligase